MSAAGKPFVSLVQPASQRPPSALWGPANFKVLLRDNFTLTTWLLLGATAQGLLFLALGRLALLPAVAVLIYRTLKAYAQSTGYLHNPYLDNVLQQKYSAQFPDEVGDHGAKPASQDIVVLLIGTRINHPLGILAPGAKEMGEFFPQMVRDLDAHAEEFDYLGMTAWVNQSNRESNNELLDVAYFRTTEGLHKFAHSDYHRVAWDWWNRTVKQHPHLSIYHEVYHAPAGHWENIYVNSHLSHFASTSMKIMDRESGEEKWASPVVDARRGLLRTSAGRMARSEAKEHERAGVVDPY